MELDIFEWKQPNVIIPASNRRSSALVSFSAFVCACARNRSFKNFRSFVRFLIFSSITWFLILRSFTLAWVNCVRCFDFTRLRFTALNVQFIFCLDWMDPRFVGKHINVDNVYSLGYFDHALCDNLHHLQMWHSFLSVSTAFCRTSCLISNQKL